MIKFVVLNGFTDNTQFAAKIDCAPDAPRGVKLGLALKWAVKNGVLLYGADLSGANLGGADLGGANLHGANLRGANLRSVNLGGADLSGADMSGADMRSAVLRDAGLRGADMRGTNLGDQWIIQGAVRSDGYAFFLQKLTGDMEPMVKAGCRYFTLGEAQKHWEQTRAGTALLAETRAIVCCMVDLAHARGLMVNGRAAS